MQRGSFNSQSKEFPSVTPRVDGSRQNYFIKKKVFTPGELSDSFGSRDKIKAQPLIEKNGLSSSMHCLKGIAANRGQYADNKPAFARLPSIVINAPNKNKCETSEEDPEIQALIEKIQVLQETVGSSVAKK